MICIPDISAFTLLIHKKADLDDMIQATATKH